MCHLKKIKNLLGKLTPCKLLPRNPSVFKSHNALYRDGCDAYTSIPSHDVSCPKGLVVANLIPSQHPSFIFFTHNLSHPKITHARGLPPSTHAHHLQQQHPPEINMHTRTHGVSHSALLRSISGVRFNLEDRPRSQRATPSSFVLELRASFFFITRSPNISIVRCIFSS